MSIFVYVQPFSVCCALSGATRLASTYDRSPFFVSTSAQRNAGRWSLGSRLLPMRYLFASVEPYPLTAQSVTPGAGLETR